jgi:hypothetical protein
MRAARTTNMSGAARPGASRSSEEGGTKAGVEQAIRRKRRT